jgi:hypothetical protein
MDRVHNPSDFEWYSPWSETFRFYLNRLCSVEWDDDSEISIGKDIKGNGHGLF